MANSTNPAALARAPQQQQDLATFNASHDSAAGATNALVRAAQRCHLVAPATSCADLPEGFSVAMSVVAVDASPDRGETYRIAGSSKLGLGKVVLDRIAGAAGVSWNPRESRRLDDGSDPRYCHYKAVGVLRGFDGRETVIQGEKIMDLRAGSPSVREIHERAEAKRRSDPSARVNPDAEIRALQRFILEHAESKAKNRAIRSLGVKTSYSPDELRKPFAVAKLAFTGRSEDPELQRRFSVMMAETVLNAAESLYGARAMAERPRYAALPAPQPPPPVGDSDADHEDDDASGDSCSTPLQDAERSAADAPQDAPASDAPPQHATDATGAPPDLSGFKVPGGPNRGKPIEDVDDRTLAFWVERVEANLVQGNCRKPDEDRALAGAMRAELARRGG